MFTPDQRTCTRAAQTQTTAHLHDVEEHLLAQTVLLLEELVLGIRAGDVSANQLLARRRHLQQLRVLVLDGHVLRVAQQLPHDGPEVVRNPFPDEILSEKENTLRRCETTNQLPGGNVHFLRGRLLFL